MDVHFEDSQKSEYVWTPDWETGTRNFFLEAYRVEKLNRLRSPEIEKFKQAAKEVLSREEIESYDEFDGVLEKIEKGLVVICSYYMEDFDTYTLIDERKLLLSIEFRAKIIEEIKSLLGWIKRYKGCSGKWIIVNGELFDVKWKK